MSLRRKVAIVMTGVAVTAVQGGCEHQQASRLSRDVLVHQGFVTQGDLIRQIRISSLAGTTPVALAGLLYHHPAERSRAVGRVNDEDVQAAAIGIARGPSYMLVGTVEAETDQFVKVCTALDGVRKAVSKIESAAQQAVMQASAAESKDAAERIASDALKEIAKANLELLTARGGLQTALDQSPGVALLQWRSQLASGATADAGDRLGATMAFGEGAAGFAVLSGIRVQSLHLGADFKRWSLSHFAVSDRGQAEYAALATTVLLAKDVRYDSSLTTMRQIGLWLDATPRSFVESDQWTRLRVEISVAVQSIASLGNSGRVGPTTWEVVPVDWECIDESAYLAQGLIGRDYGRFEFRMCTPLLDRVADGWTPVDATLTKLSTIQGLWSGGVEAPAAPPRLPGIVWSRSFDDAVVKWIVKCTRESDSQVHLRLEDGLAELELIGLVDFPHNDKVVTPAVYELFRPSAALTARLTEISSALETDASSRASELAMRALNDLDDALRDVGEASRRFDANEVELQQNECMPAAINLMRQVQRLRDFYIYGGDDTRSETPISALSHWNERPVLVDGKELVGKKYFEDLNTPEPKAESEAESEAEFEAEGEEIPLDARSPSFQSFPWHVPNKVSYLLLRIRSAEQAARALSRELEDSR